MVIQSRVIKGKVVKNVYSSLWKQQRRARKTLTSPLEVEHKNVIGKVATRELKLISILSGQQGVLEPEGTGNKEAEHIRYFTRGDECWKSQWRDWGVGVGWGLKSD